MIVRKSDFPQGFTWGVSTAAYQVEGAAELRPPSVWDTFAATPGRIRDGSTGAVACDSYHRWPEDVALLSRLGVDAYRFSISWPRVMGGDLDYYERLVDGLLAAGIEPVPTLFHWDLPQSLEDAGGWLSPETARHFGEYADGVAARLADRVRRWITLNEPREVTMLGHALGVHAPGRTLGFDAVPVAHELLRAHAAGAQALRSHGVESIGVAASHAPIWPLSDSEEDREAAGFFDLLNNWLFADPLLTGRYPPELAELMPGDPPPRDLDWYGVNYYNPMRVGAAGQSTVDGIDIGGLPFGFGEIDAPRTDFGWPVVPEGLTETLLMLDRRHPGTSYVITENGASYAAMEDEAGSTSSVATSPRCAAPSSRGSTSGATSTGHSWTTSSGPKGSRSTSD